MCKFCNDTNRHLYEDGIKSGTLSVPDVAKILNISAPTVYNHMKKHYVENTNVQLPSTNSNLQLTYVELLDKVSGDLNKIESIKNELWNTFPTMEPDNQFKALSGIMTLIESSRKNIETAAKLIEKNKNSIIDESNNNKQITFNVNFVRRED